MSDTWDEYVLMSSAVRLDARETFEVVLPFLNDGRCEAGAHDAADRCTRPIALPPFRVKAGTDMNTVAILGHMCAECRRAIFPDLVEPT